MFRYYFQLGLRSLRRNPMLTALMVVTLAVGVAASMATFTVLYVMSGDPIPHKSDRLFVPRLDNAPVAGYAAGDEPTGNLDSQMARGVLELLEDINAKGTTIVMVTHDPELAARAQRNVHIVDGMATDLSIEPSLIRVAQSATASADTSA